MRDISIGREIAYKFKGKFAEFLRGERLYWLGLRDYDGDAWHTDSNSIPGPFSSTLFCRNNNTRDPIVLEYKCILITLPSAEEATAVIVYERKRSICPFCGQIGIPRLQVSIRVLVERRLSWVNPGWSHAGYHLIWGEPAKFGHVHAGVGIGSPHDVRQSQGHDKNQNGVSYDF